MLNYHKIGTVYSEQLRNSPVGYISNWMVDSCISIGLFYHYMPACVLTGAQPPWHLLMEPTRASMGPWLGSNICTGG
jgi:hypothetical protein